MTATKTIHGLMAERREWAVCADLRERILVRGSLVLLASCGLAGTRPSTASVAAGEPAHATIAAQPSPDQGTQEAVAQAVRECLRTTRYLASRQGGMDQAGLDRVAELSETAREALLAKPFRPAVLERALAPVLALHDSWVCAGGPGGGDYDEDPDRQIRDLARSAWVRRVLLGLPEGGGWR